MPSKYAPGGLPCGYFLQQKSVVTGSDATKFRTNRVSNRESAMADPEQGGNRRGAIAGLVIAVVLLAVGLWLARELTATSKLQDCLMSGRTNCAVIPAQ
jgi:hypothetical protein